MPRRKSRLILKKRTAPGAAPGSLVVDPGAHPTHIRAIAYDGERFHEAAECVPDEILPLKGEGKVLWVDVSGLADIALIERVGHAFGLHPLAIEDVVNTHQRPKVEPYPDHLFVVFRMMVTGHAADSEQVSMVVGRDYVLTFQERPTDGFEPVRERLRRGRGRIRSLGPDHLAYALLDAAIDGFFPVLEAIGEEIEALEDAIVTAPTQSQIECLHHVKRELLALRRSIWPTRELLNGMIRDPAPEIGEATRLYLRDCYDHTIQLMDIVETYRDIAAGLLDVYLSSQSAKLNEVMKVLTIIATIFIPLSFVAGVYGMNFDVSSPWNMPELGWRFGYPFALLLMLAIALGLLWFFHRRGWLGGDEDTKR